MSALQPIEPETLSAAEFVNTCLAVLFFSLDITAGGYTAQRVFFKLRKSCIDPKLFEKETK